MTKFRKSNVCRTNSFSCQVVSLIYLHNLHWLHLFGFSPVCIIHSTPRLSAFSNRLAVNKHSRSCSICLVFKYTLKLLAWKKVAPIASFYTSPLCVHSQTVCQRKCIVALVAFVWFFSTVCSQMLPQIVCITWNIITHVTWLRVETVSLQNVALWYSMWSLKTLSHIYHTKYS